VVLLPGAVGGPASPALAHAWGGGQPALVAGRAVARVDPALALRLAVGAQGSPERVVLAMCAMCAALVALARLLCARTRVLVLGLHLATHGAERHLTQLRVGALRDYLGIAWELYTGRGGGGPRAARVLLLLWRHVAGPSMLLLQRL
jgi:hypothetical protein